MSRIPRQRLQILSLVRLCRVGIAQSPPEAAQYQANPLKLTLSMMAVPKL
jgi:hypothetical protein